VILLGQVVEDVGIKLSKRLPSTDWKEERKFKRHDMKIQILNSKRLQRFIMETINFSNLFSSYIHSSLILGNQLTFLSSSILRTAVLITSPCHNLTDSMGLMISLSAVSG